MDPQASSPWQRLLYRWFVQYNPLYLLSAALVLLGAHALYRDLMAAGYLLGQLGVPAIAEVYAWALIGGAALLTRIELRRPAVLLALLVVLYQGDLTMITETAVYLGGAGVAAAAFWLVSFVAKLGALGWALKLRLSRSALIVPTLGAVGLAVMPWLLSRVGAEVASQMVAAWLFLLFATGASMSLRVGTAVPLDDWGQTVLRRSLVATWSIWSLLLLLHVGFWSSEHRLSSWLLGPVALLVATRLARREGWVWAAVGAAIVWTGMAAPTAMWLTALMSAVIFVLRAWRQPRLRVQPEPEQPLSQGPYREPEARDAPPPPKARPQVVFEPASASARRRLLTGALAATYLSIWTYGWAGGPLPDHLLVLDALLTLLAVVGLYGRRLGEPLVVVAAVYGHYAVAAGLVSAPDSRLEWGLSSVGAGFALLLISLVVSYRLRPTALAGPAVAPRPDDAT